MRVMFCLLAFTTLSGCLCLPEGGEGIDSNYFSSCWESAKKGPRDQTLLPKP